MLIWVLYALVIVSVLTAAEGLMLLVAGDPAARRQQAKLRLQRHASRIADPIDSQSGILLDSALEGSFVDRLTGGLARRREFELLLYRAGMPYTIPQFLLLTLLFGIAVPLLAYLIAGSALISLAMVSLGALPLLSIIQRKNRRMAEFESQMPEALDLICRALRAGISLEFGFRSVGDELSDPIGTEFGQVAEEVRLGLDTRVALQNMATRMNTDDMPFFVNAILIQRETGGNLAEILDNLSHIIRERIKFHGKVKSLVAQVNLTANLLAVLPLAFGAVLSVALPGYLDVLLAPPGIYMVYGATVSVVIGWLLCRRVAAVKA